MSLPDYVAGTHHVGLAPRGGTQKGLMVAGGYNCSPQREAAPAEFGGEGDLSRGGVMSRWTQDDFSGGAYLDVWGPDPAMFAASYHLAPGLVQPTVRTIAALALWFTA